MSNLDIMYKSNSDWRDLILKDSTFTCRFWNKVKRTETCWIWIGAKKGNNNYGALRIGGKYGLTVQAHKISWYIHFGAVPINRHVLHNCDNSLCINPNHLYLGTHQDNMKDRTTRMRHNLYPALESRGIYKTQIKGHYVRS